jgi:dolichol-phosphate mannosyltransferase
VNVTIGAGSRKPSPVLPTDKPFALFRPVRSSDTLIVVPTYNERDVITPMIDALLALPAACDVLIVDDRSTDGTTDILLSRAASERRLAVMVRPAKLGVGSAHMLGWMYARHCGYRRIVTLDADFSHDPGDIPRLLAALDAGADVVIGSRFAPGGRIDYVGWRRFVSRSANYLARAVLRSPLTEHTTALRAARLDRVPEGLVETIARDGYGFFLECVMRFVRAGLNVVEIPIHFRDRQHGKSKISQIEIVRGALNLLRLKVRRTWQNSTLGDDAHCCTACEQPFLTPMPDGELRCLACGYRETAAANTTRVRAGAAAEALHDFDQSPAVAAPPVARRASR